MIREQTQQLRLLNKIFRNQQRILDLDAQRERERREYRRYIETRRRQRKSFRDNLALALQITFTGFIIAIILVMIVNIKNG